ncbi:MAG: rhomboid family intramembrane serine protease [Myxococcales bacterium]|nr:rhomboid family intramembrane serine protease [Myxococcales bacterium]
MSRPGPQAWLTWVLIGLNVAAFAATIALGLDPISPDSLRLYELGGNLGIKTLDGDFWRLGSSMFLHAGLLHLSMNMLAVHAVGRQTEVVYGRAGMLAIYVVAGLLGALASAMRGQAVSVGASGAIFGLFGAFAGFLLRHKGKLAPGAAEAALRNIAFVIGINLFISLSVKGIDMAAHVGGLVGGFATGWALEALPRAWSMIRRALVIGVLGTLVTTGATFVVPGGKPNVPVVVEEFLAAEHKVIKRWNQLGGELEAGRINEDQFIETIERELLPIWQTGRRTLEQGGLDERHSYMRRYAKIREDALVGIVAAHHAGDLAARDRHIAAFKHAEEAAKLK